MTSLKHANNGSQCVLIEAGNIYKKQTHPEFAYFQLKKRGQGLNLLDNHHQKEWIQIAPSLPDDKLELELHKLSQSIELEITRDLKEILSLETADIRQSKEYQKKYEEFVDKVNGFGFGRS